MCRTSNTNPVRTLRVTASSLPDKGRRTSNDKDLRLLVYSTKPSVNRPIKAKIVLHITLGLEH